MVSVEVTQKERVLNLVRWTEAVYHDGGPRHLPNVHRHCI